MTEMTITHAEQEWQKRLLASPHGSLILQNSFFEEVHKSNSLYMLHITTALDNIVNRGALYSSGGCLIGSVYCAPLFSDSRGLRAHNLGAYVFERETPRCLAAKSLRNRAIDALLLEVDTTPLLNTEPIGINYLHMGDIHLMTYQTLAEVLPQVLRKRIENSVTQQIKESQSFLSLCSMRLYQGIDIDAKQFFMLLTQTVTTLPILGYIYFEALSEYLILYSQDEQSKRLAAKGELNCWGYKECIFRVRPNLLHNFSLATFNPSLTELLRVFCSLEKDGTVQVSFTELVEYVKERVVFLVNACLLDAERPTTWPTWQFEELATLAPSLVGHTIDREVRRADQYQDFHFLFDESKASSIWDYWQAMDIVVPFNGILPKGEIGINPGYKNLRYKVHRGRRRYIGDDIYFQPDEELAVQILPQLIHPKHSFMGIGG